MPKPNPAARLRVATATPVSGMPIDVFDRRIAPDLRYGPVFERYDIHCCLMT
jgi:hypothetical protein